MADAPTLELRIQSNADQAVEGLKKLVSSLNTLKNKIDKGLSVDGLGNSLKQLKTSLDSAFSADTVKKVTDMADALERISKIKGGGLKNIGKRMQDKTGARAVDSAIERVRPEVSGSVGEAGNRVKAVADEMQGAASEVQTAATEFGKSNEELERTKDIANNAKKALEGMGAGFNGLGKKVDKVITPLGKVIRAFGRIAFYRVIRSILKYIGEGFKEGIGNVRAYSEAINGSFNSAMTSAEATLLKVKNSLGAALAPALEAIVPILQTLANWFITVINLANQLIALLTGKSQWTRATDASTESLDNVKKSAGGAAKAVKNLLAGFDELNIIQSESGGGGGGGGAITPDYTNMFEEVFTFDQKIREVAEWLKANFEDILKIAGDIGAVLLAWRVSNNFTGILGKLGGLIGTAILIKLEWDVTGFFDKNFLESGEPGWLIGNLLTSALGAKLASEAIGKIGAGKEVKLAVGAITLGVSAAADINAFLGDFKINGVTQNNMLVAAAGALKGGIAGLLVAKMLGLNPIGLAVGAAVATVAITVGLAVAINAKSNNLKWGEYELSDDVIEAWVNENMFSIDVPTTVNLINTTIGNAQESRAAVATEAEKLFADINVIRLGVDDQNTYADIAKQVLGPSLDGSGGLIGRLKEDIESQKQLIKLSLSLMPVTDGEGNDQSGGLLATSIEGWDAVTSALEKLGEDLSRHLTDPATGQLKKDLDVFEKEAVQEILDTIYNISQAVSSAQMTGQALVNLDIGLSDMTERTAKNAFKVYADYRKQLSDGYRKIEYAAAEQYLAEANANSVLARKAKTDDERAYYQGLADKAMEAYKTYIDGIDDRVNGYVEEAASLGKVKLIDALQQVYGNELSNIADNSKYRRHFSNAVNIFNTNGATNDIANELALGLKTALMNSLDISESEFDAYGISVGEYLSDTTKTSLFSGIADRFGLDVANALAEAIGINVPEEVTKAIEDAQAEAIRQTKLQEADDAWGKVEEQRKEVERLRQEIKTTEESMTSADFFNTDYLTAELSEAEQALAEMTAEATAMYEALGVTPPGVDMSGVTGPLNSAKNSVHSDVNSILSDFNRLNGLSFDYTYRSRGAGGMFESILPFADGGFVGTGDMFIARESGPELVGRIGNRTAVANNDQIVAGVASGVASGQAEQNALLRQQNDLLRQMVAKSGRVEAVPSAAWGRFIRSSSEMYANNAGV